VQPILVDRRQFVPKRFVEIFDDARLAPHGRSPAMNGTRYRAPDYNDYNLCGECANARWPAVRFTPLVVEKI
jgi:hypothetical protein